MHNRFYGPTNGKGCLPLTYNNEKSNPVQNIFDIFGRCSKHVWYILIRVWIIGML